MQLFLIILLVIDKTLHGSVRLHTVIQTLYSLAVLIDLLVFNIQNKIYYNLKLALLGVQRQLK